MRVAQGMRGSMPRSILIERGPLGGSDWLVGGWKSSSCAIFERSFYMDPAPPPRPPLERYKHVHVGPAKMSR